MLTAILQLIDHKSIINNNQTVHKPFLGRLSSAQL